MVEGVKLAISIFPKVILQLKDNETLKLFRSRCRDFPEETLNSGFVPTFLFYLSKSDLCTLVKFVNYLNNGGSDIKIGNLRSTETSYTVYSALILYFLTNEELKEKFLKEINLDELCPKNNVTQSANALMHLLNNLYSNSSIVTLLMKDYLLTLKRLAEALINV
ncbi:type III-B CRISPR module-associated protein Cmr5 [Sulfurisphaera tokodaii]|uniref:CRISPR type III-B/RAMP module-associated protein Cmr5 n=2 Tax=Sulfurisphaera tokodaii TaxID=111955 RepID=Q96Z55_SULTO|nr:type III-B CRISPR module-associated protein Cmr5 [Sulfurisphaera tokodaii]BAB67071.1 putative CRISPR-associated protein Cmr5 [Sulfurisphaera tokodaii str. 7]HII74441.1 type III-B CRISPR module-associated protein Cmr5 [Sulfurisphaera tokodaii]